MNQLCAHIRRVARLDSPDSGANARPSIDEMSSNNKYSSFLFCGNYNLLLKILELISSIEGPAHGVGIDCRVKRHSVQCHSDLSVATRIMSGVTLAHSEY
jgi:hypothetical protein